MKTLSLLMLFGFLTQTPAFAVNKNDLQCADALTSVGQSPGTFHKSGKAFAFFKNDDSGIYLVSESGTKVCPAPEGGFRNYSTYHLDKLRFALVNGFLIEDKSTAAVTALKCSALTTDVLNQHLIQGLTLRANQSLHDFCAHEGGWAGAIQQLKACRDLSGKETSQAAAKLLERLDRPGTPCAPSHNFKSGTGGDGYVGPASKAT